MVKKMRYSDAQLISKYTYLGPPDYRLYYEGRPVDDIPVSEWEILLNSELDLEKKTFFNMMIQRALKAHKKKD